MKSLLPSLSGWLRLASMLGILTACELPIATAQLPSRTSPGRRQQAPARPQHRPAAQLLAVGIMGRRGRQPTPRQTRWHAGGYGRSGDSLGQFASRQPGWSPGRWPPATGAGGERRARRALDSQPRRCRNRGRACRSPPHPAENSSARPRAGRVGFVRASSAGKSSGDSASN